MEVLILNNFCSWTFFDLTHRKHLLIIFKSIYLLQNSKLNRFGLRYWNQKAQFYKYHLGHFLKFKLVFFNSHYFYFSDKKNYFSNFGIRNFQNSTNDPDEICKAELDDSIAVNSINLT